MENLVGSLILSKTGRDANTIYLVYFQDKDYVYLVNGAAKKIANPKKKNIKHIQSLNYVCEAIKDKITTKSKVFDSEIFSCIKKFKNQIDILKNI